MVVTNETSLEQANDSLKRMKKGDCSKFNHLPQFLREYYGKKSLIELFGRDRDAMSIMISKFSLDARNEVRAANNDIQNMNKKEQKAMNKMLNKEARTKLNNRVKQQMGR